MVLRYRRPDIHGSYAHITYPQDDDEPHTIFIIPQGLPALDYLVSHECLHALRLFAQPEDERLMAFIGPEQQNQVTRALAPSVWQRCGDLPVPSEEIAAVYHAGIVGQVANFPSDLRIETSLFEGYPDLRPVQEATLRANIAELVLGLHKEVQKVTPPFVFRVQNALNSAYCTFIARLLGDAALAQPYRQAGFGRIGAELADQLWNTRFADYRRDRRDTESWTRKFGIERWFTWMPYRLKG
ncbi:MAG: hypothetical protein EPO21_18495 [Chloroflexota bacterium]|nr:MAG: hypothetical protein EPO21_18495 [Chloroflexota bacterium]